MSLEEGEVRRLALVRYLFRQGWERSEEPEPLASFAILFFHDAVEWFLGLVCDRYDVDSPFSFMEHWETLKVETEGQVELGHKGPMRRLNRARRQLKHAGTFIAPTSITELREATESFLTEETRTIFGASFDSLSLLDLVPSESLRERLAEAQTHAQEEQYKEAIGEAAIAFEMARKELGSNPLSGLDRVRPWGSSLDELLQIRGFRNFYEGVYQEIDAIEAVLELLSLGVDLPRYVRFRSLAPSIVQTQDGKYHQTWFGPTARNVKSEDADFCIEFVLETVLLLGSSEGDLKASSPMGPSGLV